MRKKKKKGVKFCPDCGRELKEKDKYCISCGYSFDRRKKKIKWRNVIILLIIVVIAYVAVRIITGNPLIPEPLLELFK